MSIRKGTLLSLHGSWGSGLAMLTIDEEVSRGATRLVTIPCEAGPTSRALRGAFGGTFSGQEVYFSTDENGLLLGFTETSAAPPEMVEIFEAAT